jgi:large subunit ribosomal protein L10
VEAFSIKEGFLGDQAMSEAEIKQLATLPSREQLLGQLLSVMNGPIRNFVTVLNAVQRDFTRVLQAVADQKEKQG